MELETQRLRLRPYRRDDIDRLAGLYADPDVTAFTKLGRLTRAEAFSDITLDERPLEEVIKDPQAFDRAAFVKRLGFAGPLLETIE